MLEAQRKIIKWENEKMRAKSESPGVACKSAEEHFDKPVDLLPSGRSPKPSQSSVVVSVKGGSRSIGLSLGSHQRRGNESGEGARYWNSKETSPKVCDKFRRSGAIRDRTTGVEMTSKTKQSEQESETRAKHRR